MLQSLLLLAAYVIQSVCRSWIRTASFPIFFLRARTIPKHRRKEAYRQSIGLQNRFTFPRQLASLTIALVEFQKTQSFFMLMVEISVALAFQKPVYINASSREQFINNIWYMDGVSYAGFDPIIFGMFLCARLESYLGTFLCCLWAV